MYLVAETAMFPLLQLHRCGASTHILFDPSTYSPPTTFNPKLSTRIRVNPNPNCKPVVSVTTPPARDTAIDFGKHRGKMLGSLPSHYLKWVSANLRARDFEHWAKLADEVLRDPVYKDRLEWEYADKVLNGDVLSETPVPELLEISRRFGWDNDDKVGWSRIDFQLLGTTYGGRIPRISDRVVDVDSEKVSACGNRKSKKGILIYEEQRREERRERARLRRAGPKTHAEVRLDIGRKSGRKFGDGNESVNKTRDREGTLGVHNPFPGRDALLKKALDRRKK